MDAWDLLSLPFGGLSNWFGWAAVALWWWGPHPDSAYERGSYGDRSALGKSYRVVWRVGQIVGWSILGPALVGLVWRIYAG